MAPGDAHCFPYGDVAEIGTRVLVIADGDKQKADAVATKLGEELVALRGKTQPPSFDVAAGAELGVEFNDLPVVIADPADNAGGGAPSDNTDIVRHLIDSKIEKMSAWARSRNTSPCASASMPASAARCYRCASAARSQKARASRSTPKSRSSA